MNLTNICMNVTIISKENQDVFKNFSEVQI